MKKLVLASLLFVSSLALAQADFSKGLAGVIQTLASEDMFFTGIEIPTLKKLMSNPGKVETVTYNLKDAGGFEMSYKVKKSQGFVQIFESKMTYWVTFAAFLTSDDILVGMVTSAQKASNGRGNDLQFFSIAKKKPISPVGAKWYKAVTDFANGKCKVPIENIHFELKENADDIKISGFDIFLTGKKYTLSGVLKIGEKGEITFDPKTAKC